MTWVTLFTSWQFWLVIVLNTAVSYMLPGFLSFNKLPKEGEELPPCDMSLELLNAREEIRRLTQANFALNIQNAALEDEIAVLDPGPGDYEPEQRPDEAIDGRRT